MAIEEVRPFDVARDRRFGLGRRSGVATDTAAPDGTAPSLPVPALRTFDSLSDRSFRWYFASMLGWFASMNMQQLARGVIVYDMTGSYAALGMISLANAIPGLALSPFGGLMADKLNCKLVVQMGQISNMVISAVIAALMLTGAITYEYLVASAVFQGAINALMMPARQSMIPDIVSGERLMNAIALNSAGTNVMRLAGPPVGGVLLTFLGAGWVYVAMSGLYAFGAVCLLPVVSHPEAVARHNASRRAHAGRLTNIKSLFGDLAEGCRYMTRDKTVFLILGVSFMIVLLSQPFQMLLPGFAKDVLDASPGELGLLMALIGVGALGGSLIVASMSAKRRGVVLMSSALIMGLATLAFSLSETIWISGVIALVLGVGQALRMSLSNVLIQSYTESEYRGRVMSVYMMEFSLVAFGTFLLGVLSNAIGVQSALAAMAIGMVLLAVGSLLLIPRMRRLD